MDAIFVVGAVVDVVVVVVVVSGVVTAEGPGKHSPVGLETTRNLNA